uniref:Secreted protein n=1 Tax=Ditylenchus dipsaci TaxID=166011 RepID=A0A915EEI1_9BILA
MFQNIRLVHISLLFACLYMTDCEDQWILLHCWYEKLVVDWCLEGLYKPSNVTGFLFQGIPYAQPPTAICVLLLVSK